LERSNKNNLSIYGSFLGTELEASLPGWCGDAIWWYCTSAAVCSSSSGSAINVSSGNVYAESHLTVCTHA